MLPSAKGRATVLWLGLAFLVLDQAVKLWALQALAEERFHWAASVLRLDVELHLNPGAFLSLGAALPPLVKQLIFILGVAAVVVWAAWWAWSQWRRAPDQAVWVYAIAVGGAGNLIDRVFRQGHVVDYLILGVGPLQTGVFNLADIAITAGALMLAIGLFKTPHRAVA